MPDLTQITYPLLGVVFAIFTAQWLWQVVFSNLKAIPGPFFAKFTDAYRALVTAQYDIDATQRKWHRRYGPAVRIGPNCVSISDPNLIRTIYSTKNPWVKSSMYRPNDVLINGQLISNVFNTQDEEWHNKYMRPIRPFWTMTKVLDMEPLIDETLVKFMNKMEAKFVDDAGSNKVCRGDEWLGYFAWDVTANISFGRHYGFIDQEKDVDNLIVDSTKGLYYFAPVSQIPWIDRLMDKNPLIRIGPKPTLTGVMYAFQVCGQYQAELAANKDKPTTNKIAEHSLDKYIHLKDQYPDIVNDAQIVNWLMLNILAGGDTTSAIMRATVYYLSKNPSAYAKLTSELDSTDLSFPAKWKEISNLPYLDAVLREASRMNPGLAMVLERVVPASGFTLPDGRFIPAGTKIGINPGVVTRDFDVFGPDADEFNPDRWIKRPDESYEDFKLRYRKMRDVADFIFGGGGRVCMGRYLATLEMWKLFATLYSTFDMRLCDRDHVWTYRNAWFVYQYDMPCYVRRREKGGEQEKGKA